MKASLMLLTMWYYNNQFLELELELTLFASSRSRKWDKELKKSPETFSAS